MDFQELLAGSSFVSSTDNRLDQNDDADHTYLMFSATFPKSARRLTREYMDEDCVRISMFSSPLLNE